MSSEESASYSDAQSSLGRNTTPIASSSSDNAFQPRPRQRAATSIFLRSESLFLAFLFAVIAFLLPTFFFFASNPSIKIEKAINSTELRDSPLNALLPYVPTISTVVGLSLSIFHVFLRPFLAALSLTFALLAPSFLALNILFQVLVVLPSALVTGLARFFYPVYLFCGVACLFGAGIGVCGRLIIEGTKLMLADPLDNTRFKGKKRAS